MVFSNQKSVILHFGRNNKLTDNFQLDNNIETTNN